jgi:hypothetical protein
MFIDTIQHQPDISSAICDSSRNNTELLIQMEKQIEATKFTDLQHLVAYMENPPAPGRFHQQHRL